MVNFTGNNEIETTKIGYVPGRYVFPQNWTDAELVPTSLNSSIGNDACTALPEDLDFTGKVALVRVASCWNRQQADRVYQRGGRAIIWYNNEDERWDPPNTFDPMYSGIVGAEAGEAMIETIAAGGKVTLDFTAQEGFVNMPFPGGVASEYTSWGPTFDLKLKPDVTAPGEMITSTWPTWLGTWATASGTSMATPYIAGIAALWIGQNGGRDVHGKGIAKRIHARIASSGSAMPWIEGTADGGDHFAPTNQVGTGLVDARKVLEYKTELSLTRFNLNDTHHFSRYQTVDITNDGDEEVVYTFAIQDAGGYDSYDSDNPNTSLPDVIGRARMMMYKLKPEVRFPAGTFRVAPGQTRKAE